MEKRPNICDIESGAALKQWYWLKSELLDEVRRRGLRQAGGKFDLLDRLAHFLDTGEPDLPKVKSPPRTSKFDWHSEELRPETVLTDSYKNTQNVRRFFKAHAGEQFKFTIGFMDWIKANTGRTLGDAVDEYHRRKAEEAAPGFQTDIKEHNQFNQYTRDFLDENPNLSMADLRKAWGWKRRQPTQDGRHRYEASDLKALD